MYSIKLISNYNYEIDYYLNNTTHSFTLTIVFNKFVFDSPLLSDSASPVGRLYPNGTGCTLWKRASAGASACGRRRHQLCQRCKCYQYRYSSSVQADCVQRIYCTVVHTLWRRHPWGGGGQIFFFKISSIFHNLHLHIRKKIRLAFTGLKIKFLNVQTSRKHIFQIEDYIFQYSTPPTFSHSPYILPDSLLSLPNSPLHNP